MFFFAFPDENFEDYEHAYDMYEKKADLRTQKKGAHDNENTKYIHPSVPTCLSGYNVYSIYTMCNIWTLNMCQSEPKLPNKNQSNSKHK